ncbi:3-oxoadipate enol-lactonase [Virgisporangium ochraceum]|uniref:3-oxoadipate enol-lactonase n=1 Tax=Virgisporangium ochraceum TaxID=65505 RepID=UPI001941D275|nr:3-oxoadipate enol-lactonase [Virgisporangium ochraceum]
MKPSSSPSDPFSAVLAAGPVAEAVAGPAWLRAMLAVEAALSTVEARLGLIPVPAAEAIRAACAAGVDPSVVAEGAAATGNPAEPLVRALRSALPDDIAPYVHKGATSQDVVDTAAMLVVRTAARLILADLAAAGTRAAELAAAHRRTVLSGRTLLQPALPTTFGLVAAGWATALHEASRSLSRVVSERLAVQFGGAAGTLAAFDDFGVGVLEALAAELGLAVPVAPWHTDRVRIAEIAGALGGVAGAVGKIARDVTLYGSFGELSDGQDRGGSSTMPHKRNPVAAVAAAAGAAQAPGLVATLLAAMPHEFQRAAGSWHAEWRPLRSLLEATGSAAYWLRDCLDNLVVHADRMRSTVDDNVDALMAEWAGNVLASHVGRGESRRLIRENTGPLAELVERYAPEARLDPRNYLGSAEELIDRQLRARLPEPVPLNHSVTGQGPPLLLLNSLGSDMSMWDGQVAALSERFTVIRCDTRGHGGSPVPPGPYSLDDLGADVLALLDSLEIGSAHVAGVSLGGVQAMWLAAYAPSRVRRLMLICTASRFAPASGWVERAALVRSSGTAAVADAVVARWFTSEAPPYLVAAARAMIAATPAEGYAGCCGVLEHADVGPLLGSISAATLVVSGAADPASPPDRGREIATAVPAARFETIADAAHLACLERPDTVSGLMLRFLEDA